MKRYLYILPVILIIIICFIISGISWKKAYYPIQFYSSSGLIDPNGMKVWCDTLTPSTSSGQVIDISSAGFTTITTAQVIALRNSAASDASPQVSIKTISTASLTVNITQANASLVTILGLNVLQGNGLIFSTTLSTVKLYVMVLGK